MIIINFKNYKTGKEALMLARMIERYLPKAVVAVPLVDIRMVVSETKLRVFAQHVDFFEKRNTTGFIIPEDVKKAGAVGTLLNHSEHQIREETIAKTMDRCDEVGLNVLLCVESVKQAKKYLKFEPEFMALEDRELIGSGKSITEFRSGEVKKFAKLFEDKKIVPLCGAGVSSAEDVKASFDFGCKGVLISSAIAKVGLREAEKLLGEIEELGV
ncbi:MAG: triose-phosphate isomerase [archaeon]